MREDIQCLRGIAIIFVFIFHLCPNIFVNGFLGVDMFFVISGFLMAKNLTRTDLKTGMDFVKFYYRRFRRILPLYYLMILIIVAMVHVYLGTFLWENNNRYSVASLFLVTNQLVIHDQNDYFKEFFAATNSVNVFLHFWSISLEMQFYLLVPFIFFGLQVLKKDYLKFIAVSIMTIFGYIAFISILDKFAFNFMFLRLWQFSAGFMALFWIKMNENKLPDKLKESDEKKVKSPITQDDLIAVTMSIIACCLLPSRMNVLVLRPLVTLSTAVLIGCESKNVMLLKSKTLSYIGDISYILYLLHWPVIAIFFGSTFQSYLFCILATLLPSILLHHLFEKRYLKLDWRVLIPLVFALILCNSFLQNSVREHSFWNSTFPDGVQEIVEKNTAMLPFSWEHDPMYYECINIENTGPVPGGNPNSSFGLGNCPNGNGTKSVMMIGNSYVMNFRETFRRSFNNNFSEFRFVALGEGYAVYADSPGSRNTLNIFRKEVEKYKPDILLIVARYSHSIRTPIKENDEWVKQMNENIEFYERFSKKIYILDSHPLYKSNFINYFLQFAVNRIEEIEYLHLNKRESDHLMRYAKKRFSMVKCSKCHFFDLSHLFVEGDKYLTFDSQEMISYVDNSIHLSSAGLEICRPEIKRITKEIMNSF